MTQEKDTIRQDRSALDAALCEAGAIIKGKSVKCPFHDDRHPSGSIYLGEDGAWRFKCHTASCGFCGDVFDIRERTSGRPAADQLRELAQDHRPEPKPKPRVYPDLAALKAGVFGLEAAYVYTNPQTRRPDMVVLRCRDSGGGKTFIQARPEGAGFVMRAPEKPWPIYNRTRVAAADTVIVGEGEKCVHSLADVGSVATTSPGGAGKAGYADWRPLAGKVCFLWPDNDPPDPKTGRRTGIEHMREVAAILDKLEPAPRILWIDPETLSLPPKGDCVQFLALYGGDKAAGTNAVRCALLTAEAVGASAELRTVRDDAISGKRRTIPWPWRGLSEFTRALLPGTVTVLCGDPGSVKSFMLLEACTYWHSNGERIALYELEEDRAYHLRRALAQREQQSQLTDDAWVRANPEESKAAFARHQEFLDSFGRRIHAAPDQQVTLDQLAEWVDRQCAAGCRIVAIDPITAAAASEKPWIDDLRFLMRAKTSVRQHGASLVLVSHPKKGRRIGCGLDDLAGGAAYQRFAQTILWIERHDEPQLVQVSGCAGIFNTRINRTVGIRKARNSMGAGANMGFHFDGRSLCMVEQGKIIGEGNVEAERVEQAMGGTAQADDCDLRTGGVC